jgi:hypothetical protein
MFCPLGLLQVLGFPGSLAKNWAKWFTVNSYGLQGIKTPGEGEFGVGEAITKEVNGGEPV